MLRRIGYSVALGAAGTGLALTGWPGAAASPATLINRVDVVAALAMLVALPGVTRRVFGPCADSWLARIVRAGGYASVLALLLVKTDVERFEYAVQPGGSWRAGLWSGELAFLVVLAAYVTGLLAVTARQPPARPVALAIGTGAGTAGGLLVFVLPPVGNPLHLPKAWLTLAHGLGWGVAVPLVLGGGILAGLMAARRSSDSGGRLPLADVRARQGLAAGSCAGAAAALLGSVTGLSAAALLPHRDKASLVALSRLHQVSGSVHVFVASFGHSAAGYLPVLALFPLLGAGLGAWGGLFAGGQPGRRPGGGGGGGGGPRQPGPVPPPPGGRQLSEDRRLGILSGYLRELPDLAAAPQARPDGPAPAHRERIPGGAGTSASSPCPPDRRRRLTRPRN